MVIYAAPLNRFTDATAMQLKAPAQYISVVLQHAQDRTPRALPKEAK
jgi:hypothetical protein